MSLRRERGVSVLELMLVVAALGIVLGAGARTVFRQLAAAADLIEEQQAVALAEQVLELRLSSGKLPAPAEVKALSGAKSSRLDFRAEEAPFPGTRLSKVTVAVAWAGRGAARREVKLVTLAEAGAR